MSSSDQSEWSQFQRQPISAVWQILFKTFIQLLKAFWPILLVIFIRTGSGDFPGTFSFIYYIFPAIALIKSLAEYYFYRFRISEQEVQVKQGIFSRKQTILPLSKIQTVHANQTWLQKTLHLTELAFDTPGSEVSEITFQVDQTDAENLLKNVFSKRTYLDETEPADETISELSFKDLFILGLTANHINTLMILVGLFLSFLNNIRDVITDQYEDLLEESTNQILAGSFLFLITGIVALLIFSMLVSLIRTIFTYANFKVSRNKLGFTISKGLINSTQKFIPFEKVQYLSWKTTWLRKKFPLYIFEFHTIGGAEVKSALKITVPACSELSLSQLAQEYVPIGEEDFEDPVRINPSYYYRNTFFYGLIPALILAIPAFFFAPEKTYLLLILPMYSALHFWLYRKKFSFFYKDDLIHIKTGVFGNRIIILRWEKIQSVKIDQSLFQQRKELANLVIYTAGGTISAPYIPLPVARNLQNIALYKVESKSQLWE